MSQTPNRPEGPSRLNAIIVPSGEKVGANAGRLLSVSWVRFEPSSSITQMFCPLRENVILVPSGDQSGRSSALSPVVSRSGLEPSASMTQMSRKTSETSVVNAIFEPSGDHAGQVSWLFGVLVSRVLLLPSAS